MSTHLQTEMNRIKTKLLTISSMVERNLTMAVQSIRELDDSVAKKVFDFDYEVDRMEVELEEDCLKTLALYQPVASDLRFVVVALKMNNDLERIGDLAVNLSERAKYLSPLQSVDVPFDFETMATRVRKMVKHAIQALIDMDVDVAKQVIKWDDLVDEINREMYQTVFTRIKSHPDEAEQMIHYLTVSRFLERIADNATNIAEDVIYMIDGVNIRHDRKPRSDNHHA